MLCPVQKEREPSILNVPHLDKMEQQNYDDSMQSSNISLDTSATAERTTVEPVQMSDEVTDSDTDSECSSTMVCMHLYCSISHCAMENTACMVV